MAHSTSIIDKKIDRLKKKLAGMEELQRQLETLELAREKMAEVEALIPTRTRGPRKGAAPGKKASTKKGGR